MLVLVVVLGQNLDELGSVFEQLAELIAIDPTSHRVPPQTRRRRPFNRSTIARAVS
jgi:hypothetical protein